MTITLNRLRCLNCFVLSLLAITIIIREITWKIYKKLKNANMYMYAQNAQNVQKYIKHGK